MKHVARPEINQVLKPNVCGTEAYNADFALNLLTD